MSEPRHGIIKRLYNRATELRELATTLVDAACVLQEQLDLEDQEWRKKEMKNAKAVLRAATEYLAD